MPEIETSPTQERSITQICHSLLSAANAARIPLFSPAPTQESAKPAPPTPFYFSPGFLKTLAANTFTTLRTATGADLDMRTDTPAIEVPPAPKKRTKYEPEIEASAHMERFLDMKELRVRIEMAKLALRGWKFDAIAFRGMSGALIAPPVAMELNKSLLLVRKPDDDSHSDQKVEGDVNARTYIILDDFTCSGRTQRAIKEAVSEFAPQAKCLGVLEVYYLTEKNIASGQDSKGRYKLIYTSNEKGKR